MTEARSLLPTYIASAAQTHVIRGPLSCASAVGYLEAARGRARATMFSTTFLGHQGWLFQTKGSCVLVDPLLCEDFGQTQALGYRVYPPRILKPDQFPRVSAVVLSASGIGIPAFDLSALICFQGGIFMYQQLTIA